MPSSGYHPSQVLENYKPLFSSAEMDTSSGEHISHHRHFLSSYDNGSVRRHNYSYPEMYICCQCGDGPKIWGNQPICVICQHQACDVCTHVK
ncbi:hypothetical protein BJY01DRAFT_210806 [Aspergillus pseudoustus]|uniref:Uncharacterized protein n=1 Tax=Aspergillus pseudoustus TaxID=1810923 RepID=A0ABR4KA74_9EURO